MASQKQSLPSFASILSVLSIVFYCAVFLIVELELKQQKKRINDLENNQENNPPMFQTVTSQLRILMVSLFYCGSIFYNKSVTQNVYFIFSLKKFLRVQKILYIR